MIGQDPIITQQTFQMGRTFDSMEACKKELLMQTRNNGTYDVLWDFVNKGQFEWDWLVAGCNVSSTVTVSPSPPSSVLPSSRSRWASTDASASGSDLHDRSASPIGAVMGDRRSAAAFVTHASYMLAASSCTSAALAPLASKTLSRSTMAMSLIFSRCPIAR